MPFRPCAVIPTYNHVSALNAIIARLREEGLPVIVVDDGNAPEVAKRIEEICDGKEGVTRLSHRKNAGKGAAILTALDYASRMNFTHMLQVDADGQHDLSRTAELIELARKQPDAVVTAEPIFDDTIPKARLIGRWITHFWFAVNTLSLRKTDSMCGFRVYPVETTLQTVARANIARRMGFDTEILVRLRWGNVPVVVLPVRVTYPEGNYSNFKAWDNVEISRMHAKLFFLMLWRLPVLLAARWSRKRDTSRHWAGLAERGSMAGLWIAVILYRLFGRRVCLVLLSPIVLFFFLTGGEQRHASMGYLRRAWRAGMLPREPGWRTSFRHFMTFGGAALDKFAAWTGNISLPDVDGTEDPHLYESETSGRGSFVLTGHLGNPEVIRAVASLTNRSRVNVLVHTTNAVRFNAVINRFSRSSSVRMIQVTEIGPETAILLQTAIENGESVVMVGDRVPVSEGGRVSWAPFLGEPAPFPQGPYILASILKWPVYFLFCLRHGSRFRIYFEPFAERIVLPRGDRERVINAYARQYAERLEVYLRKAPLQWFNFFDYWRPGGLTPPADMPSSAETMEQELSS
ncbi:glycosyltransferase family 2 protein [Parvibaculum sp.]|uniref:glycosyltransferase family 2 protein n=1 Tax=Parvibaculum sp. TaxID=2024848 RepID=UPI000C943458|nr:glycosyltransferase family 2 protein [Parvibaculum sp.]MAB14651.1 acyltransferase [Parvibaculum sp.]